MKKSKRLLFIGLPIVIILAIASPLIYKGYQIIYGTQLSIPKDKPQYITIPKEATIADVVTELEKINLASSDNFTLLASYMKYDSNIKSGRYQLAGEYSNIRLIRFLRSGEQMQIKFQFNNLRTKEQLAESIAQQTQIAQSDALFALNDIEQLEPLGFTPTDVYALFIPNTYFLYWTTTMLELLNRMKREYTKFWDETRTQKAKALNLTPIEVATLASIIEEESNNTKELPTIAGVYINRLRENIPLQADPTIKFVVNDFTLKRILNKYLEIDSPYNTYKYAGLPPGPIRIPSSHAIDAVLNAEKHDYIFFCAKPDNSGTHNFSKTLAQHNQYAKEYHQWLNKNKIFK